jgi:hypothetical protein
MYFEVWRYVQSYYMHVCIQPVQSSPVHSMPSSGNRLSQNQAMQYVHKQMIHFLPCPAAPSLQIGI